MTRIHAMLILLLAVGCGGSESGGESASSGERITMRIGESHQGEKMRLVFEAVEEDSRCPEGATCATEGNARIRLVYESPDHPPVEIRLNTAKGMTRDTVLQRSRITLSGLTPDRTEGRVIDPKDYRADLAVTGR